MNMIMPYYNQLYSSTTLEFNPLYDFNYSEEQTSSKTGRETKTGSREISGNSENVVGSQINRDIAENNTITNNLTNVMEYGKVESKTGNDSVQHTGSDTNNIEGVQWDKYSDTPQGGISNIDNDTYLTNARKNTDDTTNQIVYNSTNTNAYNSHVSNSGSDTESKTGSVITENSVSDAKTVSTTTTNENTETISDNKVNTITNTDEYVKRVSGKKSAKSYGVMIEEYRHSLINIDTLIIDELSDLFFGLWEWFNMIVFLPLDVIICEEWGEIIERMWD